MYLKKIYGTVFILCLILSASCSKFHKLQKSQDIDAKYQAAVKYYEKGDYYRAGVLLEELVPLIKGKAESEKIQFYYAYCQYHQSQLTLAAYYFKKFYETFPRSEYAPEAMYMYAMSLYEDSPKYTLDQTNTYEAIDALKNFLNKYPDSKNAEACAGILGLLNYKLERKNYDYSKLYYKLGHYKAAVVAIDNFNKKYPESKFNEELAYYKVYSQYKYAKMSIEAKKEERLELAKTFYESYVDNYPAGKYSKPAENVYENCIQELQKVKKNEKKS